MPEENDQHANVSADKKNGKIRHIGERVSAAELERRMSDGMAADEKKPKREPRPPKERTRFYPADDIAAIANTLIAQQGLEGMSALKHARILYLFTNAERVAGEDRAQAQRFNAKYGYTEDLEHDFVLTFSEPQMRRLSEHLWPAVVYHFLLHCGSDTVGRWHIEPHDFQGFIAELANFRDATMQLSEGLKQVKQLGLFDIEAIASSELAREEVQA